jgi:RNA polymerase sigma-70 factor (ECF subfamily)
MSDAWGTDGPGNPEPPSIAAAMSESVVASVEHPHRFEEVFEQYHGAIHGYLTRTAGPSYADEYAGEVFVTAFAARARYDPARGSVRAWLFGIAANVRHTRTRSLARGRRASSRMPREREGEDGGLETVEDRLDYGRELAWVTEFLRELPDLDREILVLYAWGELGYAEIGQVLGIEIGTVSSRLSRARKRLREQISASGEVLDESGKPQEEGEGWTSSSG